MNEERLKELEALIYVGGLMPGQAQSLINRVRELERALKQAVDLGEISLPILQLHARLKGVEQCPDLAKWLEEKGK